MEIRDPMGLPPPGPDGVVSGTGTFAAMLQRSMSSVPGGASPPPTSPARSPGFHSPAAMRSASLSVIPIASCTSNLSPAPFLSDVSAGIASHPMPVSMGMGIERTEPLKRKRGRPRKYGADGIVALTAVPLSTATVAVTPSQKRGRGRPPGSGRKQQLAALGGWLAGSAGVGFTPHVITIAAGEDVATKVMSFSQQGPRAICILSANGAISNVTLRQPATSGGTVTYEGRFEILSLSGSFLLTEIGGTRSRTGGLSVSLAGPDGRVIGGGVAGMLMAASPVQVVVGSFLSNQKKSQIQPITARTSIGSAEGQVSGTCLSFNDALVVKAAGPDSPPVNISTGLATTVNVQQVQNIAPVHLSTGVATTINVQQSQNMATPSQSVGWASSQFMPEVKQNTDIKISLQSG
eukprot:c28110_g2_i1 orf=526-1743(+)